MLMPQDVFDAFRGCGVTFYSGVPDSLLKDICAYITDNTSAGEHIIAANEGAAIALAAGHYLATRNLPLVYFQNSGLGNAINPLLSLADPEVYSIPMLLLIGWRGEPGTKDEPQHVKQGRVMLGMLGAMEIPYVILDHDQVTACDQISTAAEIARSKETPYALVVRANTFAPYKLRYDVPTSYPLVREDAIKLLLPRLEPDAVIVSTTGKTSRELFEARAANAQGHQRDFLTVGSMGHCSQIALGMALMQRKRPIYCLDGDGAVLMHMGSLAIIGTHAPRNFKHIVINNGAHDSVGGQPTAGFKIDLPKIAIACGYRHATAVSEADDVIRALEALKHADGPALLEIRVNKGARKDLGRPTRTPRENRDDLMAWLQS